MYENSITVTGLRKRYGPVTALDGMSFTVEPGRVTGFVGPNGAGKSTTMRVILGLDRPSAGEARVGNRPYRSLRYPLRHLGALLDAGALHPARTGRNHLLWLARTQGLPASRVDAVLDRVGLRSVARRRAGGYSLGMRQRLGIAAALLGDPPALMLDEPFNGMDPEGIIWMRGFLQSLAQQGRTVLVSSHLMGELEGTAGHVIVVGRGRVVADAGVAELIARMSGDRILLRTPATDRAVAALTGAGGHVEPAGPDTLVVTRLAADRVSALLTAAAVPVTELAPHRATLEEVYLRLTRDVTEFRGEAEEVAR
ncbi:MAG TPA: ATP-binding cassette domain-containing protein [Actinocatenispora sp.]